MKGYVSRSHNPSQICVSESNARLKVRQKALKSRQRRKTYVVNVHDPCVKLLVELTGGGGMSFEPPRAPCSVAEASTGGLASTSFPVLSFFRTSAPSLTSGRSLR